MRVLKFYFLFFCFSNFCSAQSSDFWITFSDKKSNHYSIQRPSEFLSQRAIARRVRQHIPITISDLPVNAEYLDEIRTLGATVVHQSKWFNAVYIRVPDENQINAIKELSFIKEVRLLSGRAVENIVPDKFGIESSSMESLIESAERSQSMLNYGPSFLQASQIGVDCLHDLGFQGQGMVIAVLDAGFANANGLPVFDSLFQNNQVLGTCDFVSGGTMVYDDHTHGMCVLSCMGGNIPGSLVGTAPKAQYWLLRTENAASESLQEEINWLVAAEFADSVGADIINSSLGYTFFDNASDNHAYADLDGNTTIITKAADMAAGKGMFVVSSAGNSGGPPWYKITAPADADSILTVGAVDSVGVIGSFSSRGLSYDGRIKPNTVARGVQAIVASPGGDVFRQSGTSFSSPITAGAVACLWQANPAKTNMEILDAIQQSASQYNTPDSIMGFGIPDFCSANGLLSGVKVNETHENSLDVYPNPFHSVIKVHFYSDKKQEIELAIFDVSGRIFFEEIKTLNPGPDHTISLSDEAFPPGIYILRVIMSDKIYYKKLVKE